MDLIVGNHIIDDLLLHEYCEGKNIKITTLYESEVKMEKATESIMKLGMIDQEKFVKSVCQVVTTLMKPNSFFVLSQYRGLFERAHQLTDWSNFVEKIFNNIENNLLKAGLTNQLGLVTAKLNDKQRKRLSNTNLVVLIMD